MREPVKLHPAYTKCLKAAQEKSGLDHGAASWLAKKIGVSRQALSYWSKVGFPADRLAKISKITGVSKDELQTIMVEFPSAVWKDLCKNAPEYAEEAIIHKNIIRKPRRADDDRSATFHVERKSTPLTKSTPKTTPEIPMKPVGGFIPISADELRTQREEAQKAGADLSIKGRAK